jgi:hypothetical protein
LKRDIIKTRSEPKAFWKTGGKFVTIPYLVSTVIHSHFFVNRLWLPSPIEKICSKAIHEKESVKSIVIEKEISIRTN